MKLHEVTVNFSEGSREDHRGSLIEMKCTLFVKATWIASNDGGTMILNN